MFESSAPNYQNVDGLRRKHFLLADDGRSAGGVYLWDSREQAEKLYDDDGAPASPPATAPSHR